MLHPSYTDLMRIVNKDIEEGETKIVNSRYSIVLATSKRARQIINGSRPLVLAKPGEKPLSVAIDELYSEQLKIIAENDHGEFDLEALMVEYSAESPSEEMATTEDATAKSEVEEGLEEDIDIDSLIEEYTDEEASADSDVEEAIEEK